MKQYRINGLPIFYKLLFAFWGAMILIGGVWTAFFYFSSKAAIERNVKESITQQMDALSSQVNDELHEGLARDVRLLASNPSVDEYMMSSETAREIIAIKMERLFLQSIRYSPNYESVSFVDSSGKEKIRVNRNGRVKIYRDFKRSELFIRLEPSVSETIHFIGPFKDEHGHYIISAGISRMDADFGKFGGVVIVNYSLANLFKTVGNIRILDENPVWILNSDGQMLNQPANSRHVLDPRAYLSKNIQRESKFMIVDKGMLIYQDMYFLPEKPLMRSVISVPYPLLLKDIRLIVRFLLIISALALLLISALAFYLSRYLSQPIISLAHAAARLSTGDLTSRVKVKTTGELQMLVDSFNRMAEDLGKRTGELLKAQEELVRSEKLGFLGLIAGNMGNELRNPLGVMNNAVFFMKTVMPDADETIKEYLDIIDSEIKNSQRILSDLLDFYRADTLRMKLVPVHELIRQSLEKSAIPENIQLQADLPEMLPAVKVDPLQMERVLKNLISNAVHAMPEGGSLRVSARLIAECGLRSREDSSESGVGSSENKHERLNSELRTQNAELHGNFIEVSVTDTGTGIAPEHMDKLFQPLFSTKSRGIGLGLALSKKLTEANGGTVKVESESGRGTVFTVTLPTDIADEEVTQNG